MALLAMLALLSCGTISRVRADKATNEAKRLRAIELTAKCSEWISSPWTSDPDTRYVEIEHQIDRQIASARSPADVLKKYKEQANQRPNDLEALFSYAYAGYCCIPTEDGFDVQAVSECVARFQSAAAEAKPDLPHVYSFVRLAFLCSFGYNRPNVGQSLLTINPDDLPVRIELITNLELSNKPEDRAQAETYLQPLAEEMPNNPKVRSVVELVGWRSAALSHDKSLAQKYIDENRRWAEEQPAGSPARSRYEELAAAMQRYEASWSAP
jgi:hypothetical protein